MAILKWSEKSNITRGESKGTSYRTLNYKALLVLAGFTVFYVLSFVYAPYASANETKAAIAQQGLTVEEILKRSEENTRGFKDLVNELEMIVTTPEGDVISRKMLIKVLAEKEDSVKSMMVFTAPKRERGVALLTHSNGAATDEQWLYLPSTRRVKKMAAGNKTSSFRGTDFSFEDLSNQAIDDFTYELVSQAIHAGTECYVIDRFPKQESGYEKVRIWIDAAHYRPMKSDFYDKKNRVFKIMTTEGYEKIEGQFWQPQRIKMENQLTGQVTELVSNKIRINSGLTANHFTEMSLRRFR